MVENLRHKVLVHLLILIPYLIYVFLHAAPHLQLHLPKAYRDQATYEAGVWQLCTVHGLLFLVLWHFALAILTPPGGICGVGAGQLWTSLYNHPFGRGSR